MKIVHLIDHWGLGGAQRAICNLVALDDEHEHSVISIYEHDTFGWDLACPILFLGKSYKNTPLIMLRLRSALKKLKPDLLHIHLNGSRVLEFFSTLGLPRNYRIIWHEHSGVEPHLIYGPVLGRALTFFFKRLKKNVLFISNSSHTTAFLQDELKIDPHKIQTVICPINASSIMRAPREIKDFPKSFNKMGTPVFGFIGRLSNQKGVLQLLDLMAPILEEFKNSQLWVIGNGPQKNDLLRIFQNSNYSSQFIYWGERNDVFTIINNLDVVIMPSQHEPYGLVAVEALLLSTPVVGYRVGGLGSILEKAPLGIPIPLNDQDCFRKEIRTAVTLTKSSAPGDLEKYDTSQVFSRLYQNLLSS